MKSQTSTKKAKDYGIPIKYMLSIPVTMTILRDEEGKEIKVANLTQFNGGIVVIDTEGRIYSDKEILPTPNKKKK